MNMLNKQKIILMLDNETLMIDRRIILEGQSLVNAGYRVCLGTKGDGIKPPFENVRGIDVHRFSDLVSPDGKVNELADAKTKILNWNSNPSNQNLEKFIRHRLYFIPRPLQNIIYALFWPPIMVVLLRNKTPLKNLFGRAFEPLIYILMMRPTFIVPYLKVLLSRTKSDSSLITPWQKYLEDFARQLKPNAVHAHDLPNLPLGKRIADQLAIPLIYDAHELYPMQHFADKDRRATLLALEKELITYADAVITVNSQCAEVLETTYAIKNVTPLTNATECPTNFNPDQRLRLWHERFKLAENVKMMVFQGGINPVRNIDQLIHAMVSLPDHIHIGFITYANDVPYYEIMTKSLGIYHRVHYVIEIPWDEVILWLASADVGIMPYQANSFNAKISSPNKLYEFVVACIPIIGSSDLVNVKRAVDEDGIGLTTVMKEPDSYASIINEMFVDPVRLAALRQNVINVRHKYLWTNEEPKLLALYKGIFDNGVAPRNNEEDEKSIIN